MRFLRRYLATPSSRFADSARKPAQSGAHMKLAHYAAYWAAKTANFDFRGEDRVDAEEFNRIIWEGLMSTPYPTERSHLDLRSHREKLLQ